MPFPATPSPFRLSRQNPSTRRNGPQFAPTPRFLLSQSATQKADDDLDVIDDDGPSSTRQVTRDPLASHSTTRPHQPDVIEDSDDVDITRHTGTRARNANELLDDAIDSTPPEEPETPGILDAEYDALFATTREGNKRRRVDASTPSALTQLDPIPSSPPDAADALAGDIDVLDSGTQRTPAPKTHQFALPISTPDVRTRTPFRGRPRFMLSSAAKPPSSQSAPKFKQATPGISPPERRKPVFVLPRSPSPKPDAEDIPAPFSPSARTLHRRGRNRSGASYVPGGMAAEVRGWVLEMGAKHEQVPRPLLPQGPETKVAGASLERLAKYFLAARVVQVSQSALSGCGCVAFLRAEVVTGNSVQGQDSDPAVNIMIMGPSRADSAVTPQIRRGDLVGIYRGLNWSLELGTDYGEPVIPGRIYGDASRCDPTEQGGHGETKEVWLVAMEWDLVETAD
ncbi:uncharacterized protein N7515_008201 [Penicillium bovifimosum]|uniref:Uncharacterized protein n=1 Tax=Penicillium bovifimosum TaxID=126998 RepID=A0A9W9KXH8_9EURO|nr:uncharacterized protein N7515_008201 [Penicillium bovifimosum]KAJ5124376.1 hypothetical protein N7515_008201 [Penicillium bovifimosum]